jgi:Flp pilus assembly protein TadD
MKNRRAVPVAVRTANRIHAERTRGLPPLVVGRLREVAQFLEQGNLAAAELALMSAAIKAPQHPEVLRWSGSLLLRQGRHAEAVAEFERALVARPHDAVLLSLLASACTDVGEDDRALAALRAAAAHATEPTELMHVANELDRHGYIEDALSQAERLLADDPDDATARLLRARSLHTLGRTDEAAAEFRSLIARGRELPAAWYGLLDQKTVRISETELASLERLEASGKFTGDPGNLLSYALGTAYESAGRYEQAFAAFARANAYARAQRPWDAARFSAQVDAVRDAFDQVHTRAEGDQGSEVVFVVGLPRSGTTLIEQVLAAHPEVEGASELPYLYRIIDAESNERGVPFPLWVPSATAADWQRLGRRYLDASARWRTQRPRSTDKLPANWFLAGAVMAMLPGARIVGLRRDPVETCWSCYKQLFAKGLVGFAYDFESLAAYCRDYIRLSSFWAARDPQRFRVQVYEEFVAEPEAQVRALLDFCGLPFDEACLRFNEAQRSVRTASAAQVRQPLRKDTARSARYGDLLAPLRNLLADPGHGEG